MIRQQKLWSHTLLTLLLIIIKINELMFYLYIAETGASIIIRKHKGLLK